MEREGASVSVSHDLALLAERLVAVDLVQNLRCHHACHVLLCTTTAVEMLMLLQHEMRMAGHPASCRGSALTEIQMLLRRASTASRAIVSENGRMRRSLNDGCRAMRIVAMHVDVHNRRVASVGIGILVIDIDVDEIAVVRD